MLTWRAMPTLASYDILANPLYRQFLAESVYFNNKKRAKIAGMVKAQKKTMANQAKTMKQQKKEDAASAALAKKYSRLKKTIKKTVQSSKFFRTLLKKGEQAEKVALEANAENVVLKGKGGGAEHRKRAPVVEKKGAEKVVCDMAHWHLSPGERAQRRARWRCSEGNQPFPYGREVRPCYPLIPVYVWCWLVQASSLSLSLKPLEYNNLQKGRGAGAGPLQLVRKPKGSGCRNMKAEANSHMQVLHMRPLSCVFSNL
jgi:hypothetical protein